MAGASGDLFRVSDEDLWPGEAGSSASAGEYFSILSIGQYWTRWSILRFLVSLIGQYRDHQVKLGKL